MTCEYSFLTEDQFPQIHRTFQEAFADYQLDMSYMTEPVLRNRAIKNGVELDASVGVFDGPKMVGITLNGIDTWKGELGAYDAGTGIIPGYRGKGIAKKMFEFAVPELKRRGVKTFVLEVLQENEPAIKAYRAVGFEVAREFDCFDLMLDNGTIESTCELPVEVRPAGKDLLDAFEDQLDWQPSWENSFGAVRRIRDDIVLNGAFVGDDCAGLLVYYPTLNWIMSLVTRREYRRRGIATHLLSHLVKNPPPGRTMITLNNVDHSDGAMLNLMKKAGFERFTTQFEMDYRI